MKTTHGLRFAILRAIDEAPGQVLEDEDVAEAVSHFVEAERDDVDAEVLSLFHCDVIERAEFADGPWRIRGLTPPRDGTRERRAGQ